MCVNIEVIVPKLEQFLLVYSLHCGSILILLWTTLRSLFCVVFFSTAILEVLIGKESPFGAWLVRGPSYNAEFFYIIYYCMLTLLICEVVILIFMFHLGIGLIRHKPHLLNHYLVCRFITWIIEIVGLFIACLYHKILIGWYLGIMIFF
ncbi:uncharacterized protein LOC116770777 isoform X2 [Danaus plexippus]|uniref:uncharacterized protein LOC116770777 isoform X2 n=1 Tax=Danaus plexippus TaxID=13037 RepID=UPI0013C4FFCA|nr:uncharacterized protein LOC116770777 isoform X2 [Danaus plexippus]